MKDLGGKGKIFAMLPIAGTTGRRRPARGAEGRAQGPSERRAAVAPSTATGTAPRPSRSRENLLQRYPKIDGVFSPAGQMSMGVAEAFDEAGRDEGLTMSPGDEYNGWMKWVVKNKKGGAVTFPTRAGQEATKLGLKILAGEPVPRGLVIPSEYIAPQGCGEVRRDEQARRLVGEQAARAVQAEVTEGSPAGHGPAAAAARDPRPGKALRRRRGARGGRLRRAAAARCTP